MTLKLFNIDSRKQGKKVISKEKVIANSEKAMARIIPCTKFMASFSAQFQCKSWIPLPSPERQMSRTHQRYQSTCCSCLPLTVFGDLLLLVTWALHSMVLTKNIFAGFKINCNLGMNGGKEVF